MKLTTFKTEQEYREWCDDEWASSYNPEYPDINHKSNWQLDKRWYVYNKGKNKEQMSTVEESMKRAAKEMNATGGMLTDDPKINKKSDAERMKMAMGRCRA